MGTKQIQVPDHYIVELSCLRKCQVSLVTMNSTYVLYTDYSVSSNECNRYSVSTM